MTNAQGYSIYGVTSQDALGLSVSGAGIVYTYQNNHFAVFYSLCIVMQVTSTAMDLTT
jgi:hypothetical protein